MRRHILWGSLCLCLSLSGCQALPFARELETTLLIQVLGVDAGEGVILTAAGDPQSGGGQGKAAVLVSEGEDMERAEAALKASGEEYIALTHVAQLVVGEDTPLRPVLEAALKEPDLGQGATVWIARGSAQGLLEGAGGGARRLSSIQLNSGVETVTVLQALMRLEERGEVSLPRLAMEEGRLEPVGMLRIREGDYGTG